MSATATEPDAGTRHAAAAEDRGTTRIEDRVVEKVAAQALAEVENATGTARRVLGLTLRATTPDSAADVTARIDGPTGTMELTMTVIYPASIREVTRQTRRHIHDRVLELTGVEVAQIDITVTGMSVQRPDKRRVR